MSFQKSCQLIINKINENGEKIPENLSKIVVSSQFFILRKTNLIKYA